MKEERIQTFVNVVKQYFDMLSAEELVIDTPYLFEGDQPSVHDYTGVIGISGVMRGVVYVTATTALLQGVLRRLKEHNISEATMIDLVGEIANTVAGNARSEFGPEFHISIPFVFKGVPQSIVLPKGERAFIIPITWQKEVGEIVVCLQNTI